MKGLRSFKITGLTDVLIGDVVTACPVHSVSVILRFDFTKWASGKSKARISQTIARSAEVERVLHGVSALRPPLQPSRDETSVAGAGGGAAAAAAAATDSIPSDLST